jgi:quercetin dioxygenase-like cupin family protein
MGFYRKEDLPVTEMLPGVDRRAVYQEGLMITLVDLAPGAVIPDHHHPHQQITYVVSGAMEFDLDGEKQVLYPGDGAVIPPDVPHSAVTLDEPCQVIDAWHPVREDYK